MAAPAEVRSTGRVPPRLSFRTPFGLLGRMRRDPLGLLTECRRRFGDATLVTAPGARMHLFFRPEHARRVLQENPRNYWKGRIQHRLTRFAGNGILFSEGDFWLHQRRLVAPAFHRGSVERLAERMVESAELLAARWERERVDADAFDVAREMSGLTLEIVSQALFGAEVETWRKERFASNITYGVEYANWLLNTLLPPPLWVPTRRNRGMRSRIREIDGFLADAVAARRRDGARGDDLLDLLLAARDEETGEPMTERQLLDECLTFISAGHETTAMALAWCWMLLALHPEAEQRLHAELDAVLAGRAPTLGDLPRLEYTRRVVHEALRLYPPAWVIGREAYGPDVVDGWRVEAGDVVILSPYVTHRHPELWESPEAFDPDRFAPDRSEGRPRYAWFPFGGGMRLCIGREFALIELPLVVASLARRVRLRLAPGVRPEADPILTLRPRGGMPMTLEARA